MSIVLKSSGARKGGTGTASVSGQEFQGVDLQRTTVSILEELDCIQGLS